MTVGQNRSSDSAHLPARRKLKPDPIAVCGSIPTTERNGNPDMNWWIAIGALLGAITGTFIGLLMFRRWDPKPYPTPKKALALTLAMHDETLQRFFRRNPDQEFTRNEIQGRCEIYDDFEFDLAFSRLTVAGFVVSRHGESR